MPKRLNYNEYIGEKYWRMEVIGLGGISKGGHQLLLCKCLCGNLRECLLHNLKTGHHMSCGCLQRETCAKNIRRKILPEGEAARNKIIDSYKRAALKKGRAYELTAEEFEYITKQSCHYCGASPSPFCAPTIRYNGLYIGNGIDRKDNSFGYVISNCLPCCEVGNRAKKNMTYDDFIIWINSLITFRGQGMR